MNPGGEHFAISDTKNESYYGLTVNRRSKMVMIPQGEISKHSSSLSCRRQAISQRDAFSIFMRQPYAKELASGIMFADRWPEPETWERELGL